MNSTNNAAPRGLPWFRAYAEMVDDPKLRLLAFEDRWHFVALLALKCSGVLDGSVEMGLLHRMVAVKLGVQVRELENIAKRLAEVSLIDPETLQPLAWDRRQAPSDSSRERTKEWRERQRTKGDRHGDGEVTVQKKSKKEIKNKKDQLQEQMRSQGSRLPLDWLLPVDQRDWARLQRPELDIDSEAAKFADYWHAKAGKDGIKTDWKAAWRYWIRSARLAGGAYAPPLSAVERVEAHIRANEAARRRDEANEAFTLDGECTRISAGGIS